MDGWRSFTNSLWNKEVNVANFVEKNYKEYTGDSSFLRSSTEKTKKIWDICLKKLEEEQKKHVLDIDCTEFSGINSFNPGYIDKENEIIVGLQTDSVLKRIVNPYGGIKLVEKELKTYGYEMDDKIHEFKKYRKTHNDGVFDVYDDSIKKARHNGLLTGLPDAYGRGRIIGDYRRIALYGIDFLIKDKENDLENVLVGPMSENLIRLREEVQEQIRALKEIKELASSYGYNISKPANDSKEAVQWLYFGYLAAVKENNGAAMSMGRIDAFLDIYFERDLNEQKITEEEIQELIDQLIIKLRLVRHLRTPEYDELFSGDPTWVTCAIGGILNEKRSLVTKTSYRILHTLENLGTAPEPNLTILWSEYLPNDFKEYCAKISVETSSIQYENDDLMRPIYGSDYGIACCVSAMKLGKDMQFFGARCNLAKALLYAINGGYDEMTNDLVLDGLEPITSDYLNYDEVVEKYKIVLNRVAFIYSNAMNIIHYMHDKYAYEKSQMALHDTFVHRYMAYGVAGLSVAVDSLSAIKNAKVKAIRNSLGITTDFEIDGTYPTYGNDIDEVDNIAISLTNYFHECLKKYKTYRDSEVTMSVLTITSNVVYGEKTGATPDGRKAHVPFAPGANPMHNRDINGAISSLNSVAKINYERDCKDGISNTFSIVPSSLGKNIESQTTNLVTLLDGYFKNKGHHLNVNVLNREMLVDAMNNPEKYPLLTIRVSGYAVRFNKLTRKQQEEVISRTFHERF